MLGALNVALCWRMLQRVDPAPDAALLGTVFYGFGTVAWYAAMLGSTWFLAHVVASTFLFLGITAALDAERREQLAAPRKRSVPVAARPGASSWQGCCTALAAVARLTTIFGAPFFVFVGGGGTWIRRAAFAGIGAVIPVALLLGYNMATTGHVFHPAYDYLRDDTGRTVPAFYHRTGPSRTRATSPRTRRSCSSGRPGRPSPRPTARETTRRPAWASFSTRTAPCFSRTRWA